MFFLSGLSEVEEFRVLEDGEVERRLLDAMVMALASDTRMFSAHIPQIGDLWAWRARPRSGWDSSCTS